MVPGPIHLPGGADGGEIMNDADALNCLIGLIAAHEGGSTIILSYDDATFEYQISRKLGQGSELLSSSRHFNRAVELAQSGKRFDP